MKKILFAAALAGAAILTACGDKGGGVRMGSLSEFDSLSYVLGANIGGIPELIQVGKTGELFESGNGKDLKRKIKKLWGDKKLCEAYSKNCKDISFDTIDEYYEKIMKVYRGEA